MSGNARQAGPVMPGGNPVLRFVVSVFLTAVGIRLTIDMLRPVFPILLGLAIAAAVVYVVVVVRRGGDRW